MKDKKPIEVQVSELTPQQFNSIPKIFRTYLIVLLTVCIICISAMVINYFLTDITVAELDNKIESLQLKIDHNIESGIYDERLYDEIDEAYDKEFLVLDRVQLVSVILGIISAVFVISSALFVKIKYPYYSEKKYFYIRKMKKQNLPNQIH